MVSCYGNPHDQRKQYSVAEAEEDADDSFIPVDEYPLDSSIKRYPGCVDYIDQEMVFSHVNKGTMISETPQLLHSQFSRRWERM